jgi:hypothetical protein
MKHAPPTRGERSVGVGRASVVVDCSARLALAWWYDYCSRGRSKASREKKDKVRLIAKINSEHDSVIATVKRSPFPLSPREFLLRQLRAAEDDDTGVLLYVADPLTSTTMVDYGTTFKTVRGETRVYARFVPLNETQCKITLHQYFDAGGWIPEWAATLQIPKTLAVVDELRNVFQRDREIDQFDRSELVATMRGAPQEYTAEEIASIERVQNKIGSLPEVDMKDVAFYDHLVSMKETFIKGEGSIILTASTIVDATSEVCAAFDYLKTSRENLKESTNLERSLINVPPHSCHGSIFHFVKDFHVPRILPREWVIKLIWKKVNDAVADKTIIYCEGLSEHPDYPSNPGRYVRGSMAALNVYEKLPPVDGVPQTRVSWTQTVNLGGFVPKRFANKLAPAMIVHLSKLRLKFDKSWELDISSRQRTVDMIRSHATEYDREELDIITKKRRDFVLFAGEKVKKLKMKSPLAVGKIALTVGDSHAWGWASTIVRGSPEDVMAFTWNTMSRGKRRDDDLEKAIDQAPNDHNQLIYSRKKTPKIISDRDFLGRTIWKKIESGYLYVAIPVEDDVLRPPLPGVVRARYPSAMKIERLGDNKTKLEYVIHPDSGGSLPHWLMNYYIESNLRKVVETQEYFQSLRSLEELDEEDGVALGEVLVIKTKAEKHRQRGETRVDARLRQRFKDFRGLREVSERYVFFQAMLARVVQNKLRPARVVKNTLCDLSVMDGAMIGAGLSLCLATNLTAEAGVDEWIGKCSALRELDEAEIWFRPMMNVVARRLLGEVAWGLKMRVFVGATLSIVDMASDINMVVFYFATDEQEKYGIILLGMVAVCLALQLLIVFVENRRSGPLKMLQEILIVLTGIKPGKRILCVCVDLFSL